MCVLDVFGVCVFFLHFEPQNLDTHSFCISLACRYLQSFFLFFETHRKILQIFFQDLLGGKIDAGKVSLNLL